MALPPVARGVVPFLAAIAAAEASGLFFFFIELCGTSTVGRESAERTTLLTTGGCS